MALANVDLFPAFAPSGAAAKLWTYTTTDSLATVMATSYWNAAFDRLGIGDSILVAVVDALPAGSRTAAPGGALLMVTGNSGGTVTIVPMFHVHF